MSIVPRGEDDLLGDISVPSSSADCGGKQVPDMSEELVVGFVGEPGEVQGADSRNDVAGKWDPEELPRWDGVFSELLYVSLNEFDFEVDFGWR